MQRRRCSCRVTVSACPAPADAPGLTSSRWEGSLTNISCRRSAGPTSHGFGQIEGADCLKSVYHPLRLRLAERISRVPVINNVARALLEKHDAHFDVVLLDLAGTLLIDIEVNIGTYRELASAVSSRGDFLFLSPDKFASMFNAQASA